MQCPRKNIILYCYGEKKLNELSTLQIIIFGIKHSGKSTIGRRLAKKLNWLFIDLDDSIEFHTQKTMGGSIRDFFRFEERKRFFEIEAMTCLVMEDHFKLQASLFS